MQEASDVDEIKHSFAFTQPSTLVEYVGGEEVRLQHVSIGEQLETQFDKAVLQVTGVQVFGQSTVADQLAYVLGKAAPEVQQRGFRSGCAQGGEYTRVAGMAGNRQRQEAELANAGIGERLPCFLSLSYVVQPAFRSEER